MLLPRTSGLQIILDAVQDAKPDIYDLTIAFPTYSGEVPTYDMGYGRKKDTDVPSMKSLLAGKGPKSVSIHAQKFSFDEVTGDLQGFLDKRWTEKEARMNYFIEHQRFPQAEGEESMRLNLSVRYQTLQSSFFWYSCT